MKRVFAILLCLSLWASNLYTDEAADLQNKNNQVDSLIGTWIKEDSPGAAIIVLQGDRILHSKGYGLADIVHLQVDMKAKVVMILKSF